jgi:hypothetical protein
MRGSEQKQARWPRNLMGNGSEFTSRPAVVLA